MRAGEAGVDSLVYLLTTRQVLATASTCLDCVPVVPLELDTVQHLFSYLIVSDTQGLQGKGEGQGSVVLCIYSTSRSRTTYCVAVYLNRAEQMSVESSPSDLSPTIIRSYLPFTLPLQAVIFGLAVLCITKHIHDHYCYIWYAS